MTQSRTSGNEDEKTALSERVLLSVRVIWLAMLLGVGAFAMIMAIDLVSPSAGSAFPEWVLSLPLFFILIMIPVAYMARYLIFKKGRTNYAVDPRAFMAGSVVFFAILEGAALFGLVMVLVGGQWLPPVAATILAGFVFLINFPVGKQLYPEPPDSLR